MLRTRNAVLLVVIMFCFAAGCRRDRHDAPDDGAADGRKTMIGRVVDQPRPPGEVGIERWRFQPKGEPSSYLRLTRIQMQEASSPEGNEIRLDKWAGEKIKVKYQTRDSTWVWGAEVVR